MGKLFLYLFGIFYAIIGALMVFATDMIRNKFFNKLLKLSDFKKMSPIPIVFGILLLLSARSNRYTLFITILGLLGIIKGVMMIVAVDKMKKMCDWCLKAKDSFYKIWGVAVIILGSIILVGIK